MKKITKLMLTLALLLVGVTGAKAAWEQVYKIDYSNYTSFPFYVMAYAPDFSDGAMVDNPVPYRKLWRGDENEFNEDIKAQCTEVTINGNTFYQQPLGSNPWRQYFIADGIPTEAGKSYTVKALVKASETCRVNVNMGDWSSALSKTIEIPASNEFVEIEWEYDEIPVKSCFLVAQPGVTNAVIEWKSLEVGYDPGSAGPVWVDIIDNDPRCFRSKEYPDGNVLPVKINDNGEFVVNAPALAEYAWDSQFWIRLPQTLAAGKNFKVSFDYKASAAVKAETQSHNEPGQYVHWGCAGDVNFTTAWQTFEKTLSVPAECSGGDKAFRCIAFNLSQSEAVDFYFKNITVKIKDEDVTEPDYPADLYIVAGTENLCGVAWNTRSMDNQMTLNSETGLYEKKYENVTINSESYPQFKVVKNCSWDTAWPSSDYVINTGTSGLFNITITYNPETNEVDVNAEEIYTMTVAGNNTTLFGMAWDPTNTNNDLTKNEDGTFSITYEGKVLEEGQIIQFKVVKNHSWDVAYPEEEDYQLNIPRSSNYDVTITFYPENKEVVATIKDNAVVSSYYLVGGEKDAAWTVGDVLTKDEDVYSIKIPYSSEYSFAIAPNTALNDLKNKVVNWNIVIRPVETTSVDFENVSGQVSTTDNSQNWTMVEKGNGEQKEFNALFSYDSKESTWTITASTTTTIGETGYATYSNAKPYTVEGATANFVTIPNRYAVLVPQDADAILPAMTGAGKNAGVILSGAGEVIIKAVAKGAVATATGIDENLLAGSGNYPYGIGTQFADNDPYTAYIFAQPEGKELGFYIADLNAGADLPAHKAFLAVPKGADAREFIGFEPGETTSIADNNRVTTTNNGDVYNLNGQRVAQPTKGLYIVNGRKFVVK